MSGAVLYTAAEARARETFQALMWALSYPGRPFKLPRQPSALLATPDADLPLNAFALIGEALLDLETSFTTRDDSLAAMLGRTGARALLPERADYHFYPRLDEAALDDIARAAGGTMLRPDTSATLIIGCAFAAGRRFRWQGPGIAAAVEVFLGGLPARFWNLRTAARRYPLGWDVYFVDHGQVIGLPRTTDVSDAGAGG